MTKLYLVYLKTSPKTLALSIWAQKHIILLQEEQILFTNSSPIAMMPINQIESILAGNGVVEKFKEVYKAKKTEREFTDEMMRELKVRFPGSLDSFFDGYETFVTYGNRKENPEREDTDAQQAWSSGFDQAEADEKNGLF